MKNEQLGMTLREVLESHEKWRESNGESGERLDLSDANLGGANLNEADLGDADLCGARLRKANLSDADLSGADLRDANLEYTCLLGTKFMGSHELDIGNGNSFLKYLRNFLGHNKDLLSNEKLQELMK